MGAESSKTYICKNEKLGIEPKLNTQVMFNMDKSISKRGISNGILLF